MEMSAQPHGMDSEVTNSGLLKLGQLVSADPIALEKWEVIMYHLVKSPASRRDLCHCQTEEKVLKTLQLWKSEKGPAATFQWFCNLVRDEFSLVHLSNRICEYVDSIRETNEIELVTEVPGPIPRCDDAIDTIESPQGVSLNVIDGDGEAAATRTDRTHSRSTANYVLLYIMYVHVWRMFKLIAPRWIQTLRPRLRGYGICFLVLSSLIVHEWRQITSQCNEKYSNSTETLETLFWDIKNECKLPYNLLISGVWGIIAEILQFIGWYKFPQGKVWVIAQAPSLLLTFFSFIVPVSDGAFNVGDSYDGFKIHKHWVRFFLKWAIFDSVFKICCCVIVWISTPPLCSPEEMEELDEAMRELEAEV